MDRLAILGGVALAGALLAPSATLARDPRGPTPLSATVPAEPPLPVPRPRPEPRPAVVPPTPPALPAPAAAPQPAPPPAEAPITAADCVARLSGLGVSVEPIAVGPQSDPRCTVAEPVRLAGFKLRDGTLVDFPDRPTIACATASTLTTYVRDLLAPLAKGTYGATLDAVWTGPGLECRTRDHIPGAKLSAHAQGLAVDIVQLRFADKRLFEVGRPKADIDVAFETAARAGACGYFHTTLGPGSDAFHETHWHFDLEPRGRTGDAKFCQ